MNSSTRPRLRLSAGLVALVLAARAQQAPASLQPTPEELSGMPAVTDAQAAALMKEVKVAEGFEATIFAAPPAVNYPVFVAAATDGTLYVSSDGNGSLDRKAHLGRVLRVRDTNGDGRADEVKAFVPDVDSPRGLVWDHDRLYLLHPPDVSVFVDKDGDGVADERKTLVTGIGWTFKDRPADHASNGLELGADGWLYAAIGDFGFLEATGTDGRKLQMRGGGVVRFRPDGSGLEAWAEGTRNILEVAVSPELEGFARDNTNDGGGWDVRFHHFSGRTQHGYPRLFKNFPDEILQPLADYGGGSGCGAAWIDEPGFPAAWNDAPFTADWGREWIYHHGLKPKGATYEVSQEEFVRVPRATDLDVDGNSAAYVASWKGASFTWVGRDVGFVARVTPKGYRPDPMPDFARLSVEDLVKGLDSSSHRRRLEAQRTLLRRVKAGGADAAQAMALLRDLAVAPGTRGAGRVAAVGALVQMGPEAHTRLARMSGEPALTATLLRVLSPEPGAAKVLSEDLIRRYLASTDPKVRREASHAAARLGHVGLGDALAGLTADADPVVAQAAVRALVDLQASTACLRILDDVGSPAGVRAGVLRALQVQSRPEVVDGLVERLSREKDAARRSGLLTALCRLHFVEGPWKGDSWGTRPDTRGPLYQPEAWAATERIASVLKAALDAAGPAEAAWIGREMARHRIPAGAAVDTLVRRAATEPSLLPAIAAQLAEAEDVPAAAVPLLVRLATADDTRDAARAQAVIALVKTADVAAWKAAVEALPRVQATKSENNLAEKASAAFRNAAKLDQVHAVFEEVAARAEGPASQLSEGVLLRLASRKVGAPEARAAATASLDAGWADRRRRIQILKAAAEVRDSSRAAQFVAALDDADAEVAKAAKEAVSKLKIDPEKFRREATAKKVGDLSVEEALTQVAAAKGEVPRGEQLFSQIGCNGCHTVRADEPLKGPYLGTIATIYKRRELAEAILLPNKTLAQGFVANHFELKDGTEVDGFVVREAADQVTVRTIAATEQTVPVAQVVKRERQDRSLMPEGLAAGLTIAEFASLLDYLEQLSKAK